MSKSSDGRTKTNKDSQSPDCFVVMPFRDSEGYTSGHFKHVYNDLIVPACKIAGFHPVRADDVKQTNLIHLDILQKLLEAPMSLCDLSTHNPNVLFELALRQSFDKPVVLIQEKGTGQIFDIAPLRYTEYRKERIYHEVLEDQAKIADAMKETFEAFQKGEGVNSIVRLLSLTQPARLVEPGDLDRDSDLRSLILAELEQIRHEFRAVTNSIKHELEYRESDSSKYDPIIDKIIENILTLDLLVDDEHTDINKVADMIDQSHGMIKSVMIDLSINKSQSNKLNGAINMLNTIQQKIELKEKKEINTFAQVEKNSTN